jgi:hypothetical protein
MKKNRNVIIILSLFVVIILAVGIIYHSYITNWLSDKYLISSFRSILEILYFVTSPFILAVAIIGLKQLTISKENAKINAKRDSFKLAAEQSKYYFEYIIPKLNDIDESMNKVKLASLGEADVSMSGKELILKYKLNPNIHIDLMSQIVETLNVIEGVAIFFTSGVAEEKVAFSTIGKTFTNSMEKFLAFICDVQKDGYYHNILELYILWNDRFNKQNALNSKIEAEKKLSEQCIIKMSTIGT